MVTGAYCEKHTIEHEQRRKEVGRQRDQERASAANRGYNSKWQKARKSYLEHHPLCVQCLDENKLTPATVVDHIVPHKGDQKLFWDKSNWQPLCKRHHDIKTAKEDGRWG